MTSGEPTPVEVWEEFDRAAARSDAQPGKPTAYAELEAILDALPVLLVETRRRKGHSLRQASSEVGVASSTLLRLENGDDVHGTTIRAVLRYVAS